MDRRPTSYDDLPLTLSVRELMPILSVGRNTAYKLKCKVCGGWLITSTPYTHRINPYLPLNQVNRVNNLVSLHRKCLEAINNPGVDISEFDEKAQQKIRRYREKLVTSHTCNN